MAGVTAALMLAGAATSAIGSISQGYAENQQAKANAAIYEAQTKNIATQKEITAEQYRTKQNVLRGQAITTAAKGGLKISGSTANSISQSIMQLQMDNSYEQYNLDVKRQNALTNARLQRMQGRQAMMSGLFQAGTTALNAGYNYYDKYWTAPTETTKTTSWFSNLRNKTKLSGGWDFSNRSTINPERTS